jgi:hypothetical protein
MRSSRVSSHFTVTNMVVARLVVGFAVVVVEKSSGTASRPTTLPRSTASAFSGTETM